jgi:hypothetical protein
MRNLRHVRLLILLTVVVVLVFGFLVVQRLRDHAKHSLCEATLRQIAIFLQSYRDNHGTYAPAYLTDEQSQPALSWRVLINEFAFYDTDWRKHMDFAVAWNRGKNRAFLQRYTRNHSYWACPASDHAASGITDYVAIVGPNTLWNTGQLPTRDSAILVVEWPESNIYWAEPRDITAEQFLGWYQRVQTGDAQLNHRRSVLYIDASFTVRNLSLDEDIERVRHLLTP